MRQALSDSIAHYQDVLDLLGEVEAALGDADPEAVLACREELDARQRVARQSDERLDQILGDEGAARLPEDLLARRKALLTEVHRRNRLLSERIEAMMAIFRSELADLRAGRTAVRGYQGESRDKGQRVRGAF